MRAMPTTGGPAGPARLLGAAGRGDEWAWVELVGRYGRLVWSVLAGSGLDPASAADVYQTVWLRLCEHVHRIEDPDALASWLATTTRREAARLRRDRARLLPVERPADGADRGAVLPGDRLLDDELRAEVRGALARIDEPARATLALLCAESRPGYRRIAELTGRPLGSIGPTRARALQKIRSHLDLT
jgi:RNA polymerase sigma factor (sigma-70 family)